jgi:hypothetical protein
MKKNATRLDRMVRVSVGLLLLVIVFVGPRTPWGWIGLVPLITGVAGFCPLYLVAGRTCRAASARRA